MKFTTKSTSGTSFFGTTIRTTVNNLIENIGEPTFEENTGDCKVNFEWELETESGKVFTIYDWKEYRPIGWYCRQTVATNLRNLSCQIL